MFAPVPFPACFLDIFMDNNAYFSVLTGRAPLTKQTIFETKYGQEEGLFE